MKKLLMIILFISFQANAGKDEAFAFMSSGQYKKAAEEFKLMASSGDTIAMVTLGNLNYGGELGYINYERAYKWWYQAYKAGNADGLSNIGVLYRDGKGVKQNLEIAYDIFIIIYMKGLGGQSTQIRNGRNLTKTIAHMDQVRIKSALCFSEEYVERYLEAQRDPVGTNRPNEIRLKDKNWWAKGELPDYECS